MTFSRSKQVFLDGFVRPPLLQRESTYWPPSLHHIQYIYIRFLYTRLASRRGSGAELRIHLAHNKMKNKKPQNKNKTAKEKKEEDNKKKMSGGARRRSRRSVVGCAVHTPELSGDCGCTSRLAFSFSLEFNID